MRQNLALLVARRWTENLEDALGALSLGVCCLALMVLPGFF